MDECINCQQSLSKEDDQNLIDTVQSVLIELARLLHE